jgi:hypothetical protein
MLKVKIEPRPAELIKKASQQRKISQEPILARDEQVGPLFPCWAVQKLRYLEIRSWPHSHM